MDINNKKKYCSDVKNVKQWLHSTKERCDSLKSHMKYMKMLYHDMPKIQENKKTLYSPNWKDSKIKTSNNDQTIISKQMNYNNSLENYSDIEYNIIHKDEPITSSLVNIISKINLQDKEEEKLQNFDKQKAAGISSITPRTYDIQNIHIQSKSLLPIQKENMVVCIMFKS